MDLLSFNRRMISRLTSGSNSSITSRTEYIHFSFVRSLQSCLFLERIVRFVSIVDRKTMPLCVSLDGQIFPLKEAPLPPLHFLCRSHLSPIFSGIKYEGKRTAILDTEPRMVKHRDGTRSNNTLHMKTEPFSRKLI